MSDFRIGYGEDIHLLVPKRKLVLGGVEIPFELGLLGHSDADVIFHALSDAILGALALGDIGKLFPDNDPNTEGIDSSIILKTCYDKAKQKGFSVGNIDISVCLEKPKLAPHILKIRESIANCLKCELDRVSVKAMSNEGVDAVGEGKAIRASAIILLKKDD